LKEGLIPRFLPQVRVHPGTLIITGEAVQHIHPGREVQLPHHPGPEAILLLREEAPKAAPVILLVRPRRAEDLHLMAADHIHQVHRREDPHTHQEVLLQGVLPQAVPPEEDANHK